MFVLHHPEHGHAVVLPIISCIIDGTLVYDTSSPPFASFISLVCPSSEVWKYLDKLVMSTITCFLVLYLSILFFRCKLNSQIFFYIWLIYFKEHLICSVNRRQAFDDDAFFNHRTSILNSGLWHVGKFCGS